MLRQVGGERLVNVKLSEPESDLPVSRAVLFPDGANRVT